MPLSLKVCVYGMRELSSATSWSSIWLWDLEWTTLSEQEGSEGQRGWQRQWQLQGQSDQPQVTLETCRETTVQHSHARGKIKQKEKQTETLTFSGQQQLQGTLTQVWRRYFVCFSPSVITHTLSFGYCWKLLLLFTNNGNWKISGKVLWKKQLATAITWPLL